MTDAQLREASRYAYRAALKTQRIPNVQEAEDAAQEAALRLLQGRAGGKATAAPSWFAMVARNYVLSQGRHRSVRLRRDRVAVGSQICLPEHLEMETAEDYEALVEYLLAGLPKAYREVMQIAGVEGKSYEETAAVLSIPLGTVMSRMFRAREILKAILRKSRVG